MNQITAQESYWLTFFEKTNYKETPRYDATIEYCKRIAKASPWAHYTTFGVSPQGRELPLIIIDKNGNFDPQSVRSMNNVVLLVEACIHPGEPDGKDAGLMLLRDIVITKKYKHLLENVTILFIPIFNVDGHERFGPFNRINQNGPKEMGWRTNATNLNLNRDFLKADAPEMQDWLKLYNEWLPEFFIDCHTTDGADYQYVLTYDMEVYDNMDSTLVQWQKDVYLKDVTERMYKANYPVFQYVSFRNWFDPRSGLKRGASPPMLSQGYTALQNRPGLLIETHMLKDYKTRVFSTYEMIVFTAELLNKEHITLKKLIKNADLYAASKNFREQKYPVKFETSKNDSILVDFLGVEYETIKSDLTGGDWFKYSDKKATFKIPCFNHAIPVVFADLPEVYIIPPEWKEVIHRIKLHGIKCLKLSKPTKIKVKSYKFKNYMWGKTPFEGRFMLETDYEIIEEDREYPAGSVVIDMNQRTARIIPYILEPKADGSFINWGFFNPVFEQKEYGESYVMEKLARKMLAEDDELKKEYEKKKADDKAFANNWLLQLNWFYSKSPYWDDRKDVYPVGKIFSRDVVNLLDME